MKCKAVITLILCSLITSCSMLADLAMNSLSPSKGGINTELVVGDKEQVLGANQDVKATSVGKVVGNSDNSTAVASANEVQVTNINIPPWLFAVTIILMVVGWVLPTPATMYNKYQQRKEKELN